MRSWLPSQSRAHLVEGRDGPLQCVEAPSSQRTPPEVHDRSPGSEPTGVDNVAVARSTCAPRQWAGLLGDDHCAHKALILRPCESLHEIPAGSSGKLFERWPLVS
jgi:hypothetical protein